MSIPSSPPPFSKALRARFRQASGVSDRSDVRDRLTALQHETAAVRRSLEETASARAYGEPAGFKGALTREARSDTHQTGLTGGGARCRKVRF